MRTVGTSRNQWLISFTDVAFLLLLVFTQMARMDTSSSQVAEMQLPAPVVAKSPELVAMQSNPDYHQLLVEKHGARPYRLVHIVRGRETARTDSLSYDELCAALKGLQGDRDHPRPVVVPLPESYSSDLLSAAAVVSKYWNSNGLAVVHTSRTGDKP
ncbi:hypothetical protein [Geomonas subterranea]|uniref:Biopolymer transporter ExbD n=1 Tax=Geomonas subterranea TaxID=2847989 RepID=A0ABX8LIA8_9BACT|nr:MULTISPECIES: hypothetical protein [Geomonas]QXE91061.1 hypothetical protein KP001_00510 [Geomonas subterranea]QXM10853.1 hypothetical protein KP002_06970 [Geomonas subterranea]